MVEWDRKASCVFGEQKPRELGFILLQRWPLAGSGTGLAVLAPRGSARRSGSTRVEVQMGTTSKGGRPPKDPSERRTEKVGVSLTPGEYEELSARADELGISRAELMRRSWEGTVPLRPVSTENVDLLLGDLRPIGVNLNQVARAFHELMPLMRSLDEPGRLKRLDRVLEMLERANAQIEQLRPVLVEMHQLLMSNWEGEGA